MLKSFLIPAGAGLYRLEPALIEQGNESLGEPEAAPDSEV